MAATTTSGIISVASGAAAILSFLYGVQPARAAIVKLNKETDDLATNVIHSNQAHTCDRGKMYIVEHDIPQADPLRLTDIHKQEIVVPHPDVQPAFGVGYAATTGVHPFGALVAVPGHPTLKFSNVASASYINSFGHHLIQMAAENSRICRFLRSPWTCAPNEKIGGGEVIEELIKRTHNVDMRLYHDQMYQARTYAYHGRIFLAGSRFGNTFSYVTVAKDAPNAAREIYLPLIQEESNNQAIAWLGTVFFGVISAYTAHQAFSK